MLECVCWMGDSIVICVIMFLQCVLFVHKYEILSGLNFKVHTHIKAHKEAYVR